MTMLSMYKISSFVRDVWALKYKKVTSFRFWHQPQKRESLLWVKSLRWKVTLGEMFIYEIVRCS